MAVVVLCCAGLVAVSLQMRCLDAAREAARLAARGDPVPAATAAGLIPVGASIDLRRDGEYVVARVSSHSPLLPGVVIVGEAISLTETVR